MQDRHLEQVFKETESLSTCINKGSEISLTTLLCAISNRCKFKHSFTHTSVKC
jgi:hypothetical protein